MKTISILSALVGFFLLASVIQNRAWAPTAVEYVLDEVNIVVADVIADSRRKGESSEITRNKAQVIRDVVLIIADYLASEKYDASGRKKGKQ